MIILWILLFLGGYVIIYYAADVFIDNLRDFCLTFGLSAFIMGSLIMGIDPEESVASIMAGINGLPYVAVGNVIGNSIIAITLCFAIPALFYQFKFRKIANFYFLILYIALSVIVIGFFINFGLLITGIVALGIYFVYLIRNVQRSRALEGDKEGFEFEIDVDDDTKKNNNEEEEEKSITRMTILIIASFGIIFLGGQLMIMAVKEIITEIIVMTGIAETTLESFFGFVVIAFVTNVEEITLMVKSIKKHSVEIGLGGMLGKLIWNLTLTFGISGVILITMPFIWDLLLNAIILFIVLTIFYLIMKKGSMNRRDGLILALFFILFLIINFI
ncbi:MAG: sodium:calcium antiporter [Candidatus Helarchaeota archaeon]